jgi:hypothetical protein
VVSDLKDILKSKTFWASIGAACAVAGGYFAGEINATQAITGILLAMSQIFQRQAIAKAA